MHTMKSSLRTANCIMIAQILHFPHRFRGQFCQLPPLRVTFSRKWTIIIMQFALFIATR
jgi:hypothetical protein